jgi:hypothetical protein
VQSVRACVEHVFVVYDSDSTRVIEERCIPFTTNCAPVASGYMELLWAVLRISATQT